MAIQVRRGNKSDLDFSKAVAGEPLAPLDTKELYLTFSAGDVKKIATYEDMVDNIRDAETEIIAELTDGVDTAIADCNTAATNANNTNDSITNEETLRVIAENKREDDITGEAYRIANENIRIQSENERIVNENERKNSENIRITNENNRESNESERILAENTRRINEDERISSENVRNIAELNRDLAETERQAFYNAYTVYEPHELGKQYVVGNHVTYDGSTYQALLDNVDHLPPINGDETWLLTSKKGDQGIQGNDGFSPTITVDTATPTEYKLNITDVNGTFITPNLKGADGDMHVEVYDPNGKATDIFTYVDNKTDELSEIIEKETTLTQITLTQQKSEFNTGTGTSNLNVNLDYSSDIESQSGLKIKGSTVKNLIKNGDFSDGLTNWRNVNLPNYSITDNVITFTAIEGSQSISQQFPLVAGNKIYVSANIKADSNSVKLRIGINFISHSGSGMYEIVSGIFGSTNGSIAIIDGRTSNWTEISVFDVMCINLTETFGVGNEPTKEECDKIFNHYIDGLQSVSSNRIVSIGKNLFNKDEDITYGKRMELLDGTYTDNVYYSCSNYIKIRKDVQYYQSNIYSLALYDLKKSYVGMINSRPFSSTIEGFVKMCFVNTKIESVQLEEGTSATTYESYKYSELKTTLPQSLKRLPNGIYDYVDTTNNSSKVTYNTNTIVLNSNADSWMDFDSSSTNTIRVDYIIPDIINSNISDTDVPSHIYTTSLTIRSKDRLYNDDIEGISIYADNYNRIFVRILKSKLSSVDLEGFISWLSNNPITLTYQLANPITYNNGENGFSQTGNLEVYPNGIIYQEELELKQYNNVILDIAYDIPYRSIMLTTNKQLIKLNKEKLSANGIANNLVTTEEGLVLDARQGKVLQNQIDILNNNFTDGSIVLNSNWTQTSSSSLLRKSNNIATCWVTVKSTNEISAETDIMTFSFTNTIPINCIFKIKGQNTLYDGYVMDNKLYTSSAIPIDTEIIININYPTT